MSLRQFRENRTSVKTRTDILVDSSHKIATEQLIPQIAQMSRNAVTVDRTEFYFFRKKRTGRRCSCFAIESSPDGNCLVCIGSGITGGWDKYGCQEEMVEASRPGLRLINVRPAYELLRRPVYFALDDGAKVGFIECDVEVRANIQHVDLLQLNAATTDPAKSKVLGFIKTPEMNDFVVLNDASLSRALYGKSFTIRIRLQRDSAAVVSPMLRDMRIRYRLIDQPRIIADIPVRQESIVLQEFGIYETSQQITMYVPDNPRKVGNEDFFVMVEEGSKWRVVESAPNQPSHQLTSHMLTCQSIPAHHPLYDFPI